MPSAFPSRILDQIVTQIPFSWYQRDLAINSPKYDLPRLAALDERLAGLLDGLLELSPDEFVACGSNLNAKTPGGRFATTFYSVRKRQSDLLFQSIDAAANDKKQFRAFVSAAGWLEAEEIDPIIEYLLKERNPNRQALGIASGTAHRKDLGQVLSSSMSGEHTFLCRQAVQAVLRLGRSDLSSQLPNYFSHADDDLRFQAAAAAAVFGIKRAAPILKEITCSGSRYAEQAAWFAAFCIDEAEWADWVKSLMSTPKTIRCAIRSIMAAGYISFVPWILDLMKDSAFSRIAGEAFCSLTGVDLGRLHLDMDKPSHPDGLPNGNPRNNSVTIPADAELIEPDTTKVLNWWQNNQFSFTPSLRWFLGMPMKTSSLCTVLQNATQKQRGDAAILLLHFQKGSPQFPTHAPARRQKRQLGLR